MNPGTESIYELYGMTSPHALEEIASELPGVPELELADYSRVIVLLHDDKRLSFRKIVGFLQDHGIETNRSAVYRVYKEAGPPAGEGDPLIDDETGEVVEP